MGFVRIDNPNIKDCGDFIDIIPVIGHHMGSIRENNKKDTLIQQHKLFMTANQTEFEKDDIQRCLDAGMNMHMSKPVNMEKLLKALAKFKGEVIVDC